MKLRPISAEKFIRIIESLGFEKIRQTGSHSFWRHSDGRTTVIPIHPGEKISRGLLTKILKDIELSREEFLALLK